MGYCKFVIRIYLECHGVVVWTSPYWQLLPPQIPIYFYPNSRQGLLIVELCRMRPKSLRVISGLDLYIQSLSTVKIRHITILSVVQNGLSICSYGSCNSRQECYRGCHCSSCYEETDGSKSTGSLPQCYGSKIFRRRYVWIHLALFYRLLGSPYLQPIYLKEHQRF